MAEEQLKKESGDNWALQALDVAFLCFLGILMFWRQSSHGNKMNAWCTTEHVLLRSQNIKTLIERISPQDGGYLILYTEAVKHCKSMTSGKEIISELHLQETSVIRPRLNCTALMTAAKRWEKEITAALKVLWILLAQVSSPVITLFPSLPPKHHLNIFNIAVSLEK